MEFLRYLQIHHYILETEQVKCWKDQGVSFLGLKKRMLLIDILEKGNIITEKDLAPF